MKRQILALLFMAAAAATLQAQQPSVPATAVSSAPIFGYLSYDTVFRQMPDYQQARESFQALKAKYDAEARRAEEEFQRKFAEFLQGQADFPVSIMQKRQAELQDLMEKSISFRQSSQQLLRQAEQQMQQPVAQRLNQVLQDIGNERHFLFILNTDADACPFVHPQAGVDVTADVLTKLGLQAPTTGE